MLKERIENYKKISKEAEKAEKEKDIKYRKITRYNFIGDKTDVLYNMKCVNVNEIKLEAGLYMDEMNYTVSYCPYFYSNKKCCYDVCNYCKDNNEYIDAYNKYKDLRLQKWKSFFRIFIKSI